MSFGIALSGLAAASAELEVVGNNIANANTNGFKQSRAEFADVLTSTQVTSASGLVGSGVRLTSTDQLFDKGPTEFTGRSLDLSIDGDGFFVLNDGGTRSYTRNGQLHIDKDGFLVNSQNSRVMSFGVDAAGAVSGILSDTQIQNISNSPQMTSRLDVGLNLDSSESSPAAPFVTGFTSTDAAPDPSTYNRSAPLTVFDSLGASHIMTMYYVKTATPNTWEVHVAVDGNYVDADTATAGAGPQTLTFDTAGNLISPAGGVFTTEAFVPVAGSTTPQPITLDLSTTTQFGSAFTVNTLRQDGYASGQLEGVSVSDDGVLFANFDNGQSQVLGQLAIANFSSPQGLGQLGSTTWSETFKSGAPTIGTPGATSVASISAGTLENSNVDLTEMLVNLITAQRNFQANAKTIETEDAITQTIINI